MPCKHLEHVRMTRRDVCRRVTPKKKTYNFFTIIQFNVESEPATAMSASQHQPANRPGRPPTDGGVHDPTSQPAAAKCECEWLKVNSKPKVPSQNF